MYILIIFTYLFIYFNNVALFLRFRLTRMFVLSQGSVEPMQIDADPQEDQQNASESNYIVENPTLVLTGQTLMNAP